MKLFFFTITVVTILILLIIWSTYRESQKSLSLRSIYDSGDKSRINDEFTLANLAKCEQSLARSDKAISINPNNYEAWADRGANLWQLERLEEALISCDLAISINPNRYEAWCNRAEGVTSTPLTFAQNDFWSMR